MQLFGTIHNTLLALTISGVASPHAVRRQGRPETIAFLSLMGAITAAGIDVMLPAFDEMRETFGLAPDSTQLTTMLTTYFVGLGLGQLFWGPVSDAIGRKRTLRAALTIYVLAALGCAWGPSLNALFAFRFIWGLGAAGTVVLSLAIPRDRTSGDDLARLLMLVQTVFMLGPVISPMLGQIIVSLVSWRWVFVLCVILAFIVAFWSTRLEETLPIDRRRPLTFGRTLAGARAVVSNRTTLGYGISRLFNVGGFFIYLGSAELIFGDIYGKGDTFAWFFGGQAAIMGAISLASSRFVRRVGALAVLRWAMISLVISAIALLILSVATDGVPNLWVWFGILTITNSASTIVTPATNSLSMEPMGDMAGTASGILGAVAISGGAMLAAIFSGQISGSVTPFAVGYLLYSCLSAGAFLWASAETAVARHAVSTTTAR